MSAPTPWHALSLPGFPAITLPVARNTARLPIGLPMAAPAGADGSLLSAAWCCERQLRFGPRP